MSLVVSTASTLTAQPGGMTFLDLVDRLRLEAGASGSGPSTVLNQNGEYERLVLWINTAWNDIQADEQDWQWMRKTVTFTTQNGVPTYSPSLIGLTDFGMWARDTFRCYQNPTVTISIANPAVVTLQSHGLSTNDKVRFFTDGVLPNGIVSGITYYVLSALTADTFVISLSKGGSPVVTMGSQSGTHTMTSSNSTIFAGFNNEIFLSYIEYEMWRNTYEYSGYRQTRTRPYEVTITPDKSIGLGPFPASGYTIIGDYFSVPTEMVNDADEPALPVQFRMAIVWKALMFYGSYEGAGDAYQRGEIEFNKMMRRMRKDRLPEILIPGALT